MSLSYREIAEILKLIDASDVDELELEFDGVRLVVSRSGSARVREASGVSPPPDVPSSGGRARAESEPESGAARGSEPAVEARSDGRIEVRAPMVGTFYRAPSPEEPPFVEEGAEIKAGDALCLIEVMKLFTTIEARVAGRVGEILVPDGTLVEYGQPLFLIVPAGAATAGGEDD